MSDKEIFEKLDNILNYEEVPSYFINSIRNDKEFKESKFNILNKLEGIEQEKKFHPEGNVWNHTCMVTDKAAEVSSFAGDKRSFMWAALLHDVGKVTNTKWIRGRWRSYDHDTAGANIVRDILSLVSSDEKFNLRVEKLVKFHMHHIYIDKNLPFGDMKGLIDTNNIKDLMLMFTCDKLGRGNQDTKDRKNIFCELKSILGKIEKEANCQYKDIKEILSYIERKECSLK